MDDQQLPPLAQLILPDLYEAFAPTLASISVNAQQSQFADMLNIVIERVMLRANSMLDDASLAELDSLLDAGKDADVPAFIAAAVPNFSAIVKDETQKYISETKDILSGLQT